MVLIDGLLVAFTKRNQLLAWSMQPLSHQAESRPSNMFHRCWTIDLRLLHSRDSSLLRPAHHILDLYSPFEDTLSIPVLPSPWYLASPATTFPLVFDITHRPSDLARRRLWQDATRFRLTLSHALSQEDFMSNTATRGLPALSIERVSCFRFPRCLLAFPETAQIPGWFSVGAYQTDRPLPPGTVPYQLTCVYEPGVGVEGSDSYLNSAAEPTEEGLDSDLSVVGGAVAVDSGMESGTRSARLSMLYQGSVCGVGMCVSGRAAHGVFYHKLQGCGTCVLDQELFPVVT